MDSHEHGIQTARPEQPWQWGFRVVDFWTTCRGTATAGARHLHNEELDRAYRLLRCLQTLNVNRAIRFADSRAGGGAFLGLTPQATDWRRFAAQELADFGAMVTSMRHAN